MHTAIARILKRKEIGARRRATFGTGVAIPFVARGGCDRGVVAAMSVPQAVRGSNHGHGCLVVSSTYRLPHGRR